MKFTVNYFVLLLLLSSGITFSGCISYTAVSSGGTVYKKDKINYSKAYYSEKENTIAIAVDGKLKKHANGKQYMLLDLDNVLSIYKPTIGNYVSYATPEQKQKLGISEVYDSWYYEDSTMSLGVDVYKSKFEKGEFNDKSFKLINTLSKKDIIDDNGEIKLLVWSELPSSNKDLEGIGTLEVCLIKDEKTAWWRYCYLPVTIPLDVATSPVQIVFAVIIINALNKARR